MTDTTVATRLDLWVAGTMHASVDAEVRLSRVGLSLQDARREVQELNRSGLSDYSRLDAQLLETLFGPPVSRGVRGPVYLLRLWQEHLYRWHIAADGRTASDGGFQRRDPRPLEISEPRSAEVVKNALRVWHHTDEDVSEALGDPTKEESWWPQQTLRYGALSEGTMLVLTFDHGLLCESILESDATPRHA